VREFPSPAAGLAPHSPLGSQGASASASTQPATTGTPVAGLHGGPDLQVAPLASIPTSTVRCRSTAISGLLGVVGLALLASVWPLWPASAGWSLALPLVAFIWGLSSLAMGLLFAQRS